MQDSVDTDADLVARAGQGDRLAASELVLKHTDKIMGVCFRMLGDRASAEDATQETFIRLWKHASRWRDKGAKIETWLYRVASNICLDRLRKTGREAPEDAIPEQVDRAKPADAAMIEDEQRAIIENALNSLAERQRLAITLCHYQELSNIEAAEIMETTVEAVESLLSRARRNLRERLVSMKTELMEGRAS